MSEWGTRSKIGGWWPENWRPENERVGNRFKIGGWWPENWWPENWWPENWWPKNE